MVTGPRDLIVFDMDGVLVEVTESYHAAIQATVAHFTGYEPTRPEIQDWKNKGGWNDDWQLSHRLIREQGIEVEYQAVVDYFQSIFLGQNYDGLILREEWLAEDGLFDRLQRQHRLAIFTGRLGWEAGITLKRFGAGFFDPIVGSDHVTKLKPDPEGLLKIVSSVPHRKVWYVGDSVDDARSGRAAGVPFIGIAAPANTRYEELVGLLTGEGAVAVIPDINHLEAAIAQNS